MKNEAPRIRRFYKHVLLGPHDDGVVILLDGRMAKTPGGKPIVVPNEKLARAIFDEWSGQGEFLDRSAMPLTTLLSGAIDGGGVAADAAREDVLKYLRSDLVCYRAETPAALAARQAAAWNPYVDFMRREFGAILVVTTGVVAVGQPEASIVAVRRALGKETAEILTALRAATAIAGSAALALALWRGVFPAEEVFEASRVDERFQEQRWGEDAEAKARENNLRRDFLCAGQFLALLRP